MTVQYEGSELYSIHIGHQKFQLSKDEIKEIQTLNLETMKSYEKSVSELEDDVEEIKDKVSDLTYKLSEHFETLLKIIDDDIFAEDSFNSREEEIQKIIEKLQQI